MVELLGWGYVLTLAIGLVGMGLGVLQIPSVRVKDEIWISKTCFSLSACILSARIIYWVFISERGDWQLRSIICAFVLLCLAFFLHLAWSYLNRRLTALVDDLRDHKISELRYFIKNSRELFTGGWMPLTHENISKKRSYEKMVETFLLDYYDAEHVDMFREYDDDLLDILLKALLEKTSPDYEALKLKQIRNALEE